ncbi:MAG TPA: site-specific DNA-methyltransferase [Pyrinomonadaceae bacterium]|nr:site-specific DNA-methyltransferase [Pyrinomonadaceae bacterium]
MAEFQLHTGDALAVLKGLDSESVQTCVTSPPYFGLRDYGIDGQLGLEASPELYVERLVSIFREVKRVLRKDGTLWLNLGDSYAGSWGNYGGQNRGKGKQREITNGSKAHQKAYDGLEAWRPATSNKLDGIKSKELIGIPWMVAFALRSDGWYLRSEIIWHKPNPMPESVTDRPTKAHEQIFLLTKSPRYFYDLEAIKEPLKDASLARLGRGINDGHKNVEGAPGQTPHALHQPRENVRGHASGLEVPHAANGQQRHGNQIKPPKFGGNNLCPDTRLQSGNEWNPEASGANKKTVWTVATVGYREAHFATFPPELIKPCILAGSREGDTVLDPFNGAGTTGLVALRHNRNYIGIELNPEYVEMSRRRLFNDAPLLNQERVA